MILNKEKFLERDTMAAQLLELPEKVLQFGTGVLLRGLIDHFIDHANRHGNFNGRVIMVKSTAQGNTDQFSKQDNLYTICTRGIENGEIINYNEINASISRVLNASADWNSLLQAGTNRDLKIVVSNTTEAGLVFEEELIKDRVPHSFPGKLLALLHERYRVLGNGPASGMIIIPTELIPENGRLLKNIILDLAHFNQLDKDFISWLETQNHFCDSLVDRIVPGKPSGDELESITTELGYEDELLIKAEPYMLWAIEAPETFSDILSFNNNNPQVIIAPDISKYRELKLRLLNGAHTLSCGPALCKGFKTVKEALADKSFLQFMEELLFSEILPAVPMQIAQEEKTDFAKKVIDRFKNPFLDHQWLSISLHFTSKLKTRAVPLLLNYYRLFNRTPVHIAEGFAGYIKFMNENRDVNAILSDGQLWGTDLTALPGFRQKVQELFES